MSGSKVAEVRRSWTKVVAGSRKEELGIPKTRSFELYCICQGFRKTACVWVACTHVCVWRWGSLTYWKEHSPLIMKSEKSPDQHLEIWRTRRADGNPKVRDAGELMSQSYESWSPRRTSVLAESELHIPVQCSKWEVPFHSAISVYSV